MIKKNYSYKFIFPLNTSIVDVMFCFRCFYDSSHKYRVSDFSGDFNTGYFFVLSFVRPIDIHIVSGISSRCNVKVDIIPIKF